MEEWLKPLARAIGTAEPTFMPERGRLTHYVVSPEAFDGLVQLHQSIARHAYGESEQPAKVSDEAILRAVVQIMEMNGCGRNSGWELDLTLERARDTEVVLRTMIDGSILEQEQS